MSLTSHPTAQNILLAEWQRGRGRGEAPHTERRKGTVLSHKALHGSERVCVNSSPRGKVRLPKEIQQLVQVMLVQFLFISSILSWQK